jgi:hypothetical protein
VVQSVAGERGGRDGVLSMSKSNIVDFPRSERPTAGQIAAQDRRGREERIDQLRSVLGENHKMGGEDQITVAQALYDLLDRIERQHRITKAKILREAGKGSEGDSTKHLSHYAIPRDLPLEEIQRRSARLRKGTEPYKNIARAAARLADLDEGNVLLQVFEQASFWRGVGREAAPGFVELAFRLRFVADGISKKYDLDTFFREVERAGVSPAPTRECIQRNAEDHRLFGEQIAIEYYPLNPDLTEIFSTDVWLGWPIELNQLTWLCLSEEGGHYLPAYPSLILGAWKLGNPFPISIRNRSEAKEPVSAQGWPAVVLRFCIAPVGKERSATPVLRIDLLAYIEVQVGSLWRTPHWFGLRPWLPWVTIANYEMQIERVPKLTPPFASRDVERHWSEDYPNTLFLPINGTVCEDWLSFPISQNLYNVDEWPVDERPLHDRALGHLLLENFHPAPFSSFGSDTLAGLVDAALCDPTAGLDLLLEQQVNRRQTAFEASRAAVRDSRDKGWEVVTKRWGRDENL